MLRNLIILLILLGHISFAQEAKDSVSLSSLKFDGIYFGLDGGSQNVFGGSFVDGVDILAQESKFVGELLFGGRKQFLKGKLFLGLEFQLGFLNGQLHHKDLVRDLEIEYQNRSQHGFGGIVGTALGKSKKVAVFGYMNETKRKFEVDIMQGASRFSQKDKQGMLKYGIGAELNVHKKFNFRGTFGAMRVDFGDLITNIDVEDKYDFIIALIWQI
jgi:hypothetical protein